MKQWGHMFSFLRKEKNPLVIKKKRELKTLQVTICDIFDNPHPLLKKGDRDMCIQL
jgi:hypothetical protein